MQPGGKDTPYGFQGPLSLYEVRALPDIHSPLWDVKMVSQAPVPPTVLTMSTGICRAEEMVSPYTLLASTFQAPTQRPLGACLLMNTCNLLLLGGSHLKPHLSTGLLITGVAKFSLWAQKERESLVRCCFARNNNKKWREGKTGFQGPLLSSPELPQHLQICTEKNSPSREGSVPGWGAWMKILDMPRLQPGLAPCWTTWELRTSFTLLPRI